MECSISICGIPRDGLSPSETGVDVPIAVVATFARLRYFSSLRSTARSLPEESADGQRRLHKPGARAAPIHIVCWHYGGPKSARDPPSQALPHSTQFAHGPMHMQTRPSSGPWSVPMARFLMHRRTGRSQGQRSSGDEGANDASIRASPGPLGRQPRGCGNLLRLSSSFSPRPAQSSRVYVGGRRIRTWRTS
ncbi:hypothetical protein BV20DRAFT_292949 [Pilatotrama ljubarskyi]|nr:hypothetical protein BV20DRAFT_292949 [Pilatotrama ljubarskyi]